MASSTANHNSKKVLGESLQNNFRKEKIKKHIPQVVSDHDTKVLNIVKRRAYQLDKSLFNCCGIRFGWSSVIGIIPIVGDVLDTILAIMVLRSCQQVQGGLPKYVQAKMIFNIIIDFGIGLVPFLGDIADALFRANSKNALVLEGYLHKKSLTRQGAVV